MFETVSTLNFYCGAEKSSKVILVSMDSSSLLLTSGKVKASLKFLFIPPLKQKLQPKIFLSSSFP